MTIKVINCDWPVCTCCCGCPICVSEETLYITIAGVEAATGDGGCADCSPWNAKWALTASDLNAEDQCRWEKSDDLPCEGSWLTLDVICTGEVPIAIEAAVYENGSFKGDWRRFDDGVCDHPTFGQGYDCLEDIGELGEFQKSAEAEDQCHWLNSTVTITRT